MSAAALGDMLWKSESQIEIQGRLENGEWRQNYRRTGEEKDAVVVLGIRDVGENDVETLRYNLFKVGLVRADVHRAAVGCRAQLRRLKYLKIQISGTF